MKRPRLASATLLANFRMALTFIDGSVFTVDFTPFFDESPGLAPLRNAEAFAKATIIPSGGWTVEWPEFDIQTGLRVFSAAPLTNPGERLLPGA